MAKEHIGWAVNQTIWYAAHSESSNPFTVSFWLRLDILWSLIPLDVGGGRMNTVLRGASVFDRLSVLLAGILICSVVLESTIFAATKQQNKLLANAEIKADDTRSLLKTGWKPPWRSPPRPKLIYLLILSALHDGATYQVAGWLNTDSLRGQLRLYILLSVVEAPFLAVYLQNVLSRQDLWFSHLSGLSYLDLYKLLWLPTLLAAVAKGMTVYGTILWLRSSLLYLSMIDASQMPTLSVWDVIMDAPAVFFGMIGVAATWIVLVIPSTSASLISHIFLLPASQRTYNASQKIPCREIMSRPTFASSITLTVESWRVLSSSRLMATGLRMLALATLGFMCAPGALHVIRYDK